MSKVSRFSQFFTPKLRNGAIAGALFKRARPTGVERPALDDKIFSPQNPEFVHDPYPAYEVLRENDPVHFSANGYWVLTRYDHVSEALTDPRLSNAPSQYSLVHPQNKERYEAAAIANQIVAFHDQPRHVVLRRFITTSFHGYLQDHEPIFRDIADQLVADFPRSGPFEFVNSFSIPFATKTVCRVMGFPDEDAPRIKQWSSMLFHLFHSFPSEKIFEQVNRALAEFREYVENAVQDRHVTPKNDLLTGLLRTGLQEHDLDRRAVVANAMLLTSNGIENVQAGLSSCVNRLLCNPQHLQQLFDSPGSMKPTIEECLRLESPGQYQGRIATETLEIGGKRILAGSVLLLVLASANRDATVFQAPNKFSIDRKGPRHLAFGMGQHACIGGKLVTQEFDAALRALFDRPNQLGLAGGGPKWTARAGHRWPASLHLEFSN